MADTLYNGLQSSPLAELLRQYHNPGPPPLPAPLDPAGIHNFTNVREFHSDAAGNIIEGESPESQLLKRMKNPFLIMGDH